MIVQRCPEQICLQSLLVSCVRLRDVMGGGAEVFRWPLSCAPWGRRLSVHLFFSQWLQTPDQSRQRSLHRPACCAQQHPGQPLRWVGTAPLTASGAGKRRRRPTRCQHGPRSPGSSVSQKMTDIPNFQENAKPSQLWRSIWNSEVKLSEHNAAAEFRNLLTYSAEKSSWAFARPL